MYKINIETASQKKMDTNVTTKTIFEVINPIPLFDSRELLKVKEDKRTKLYDLYTKHYSLCIEKIKKANKLGKTDILFTVPAFILGEGDYKSKNCVDYIQYKLNNNKMDTILVNDRTIFITWHYLELDLKS